MFAAAGGGGGHAPLESGGYAAAPAVPLEGSDMNVKRKDSVVFTLGRYQPPHIGHGALIQELIEKATERNADAYVFVSDKYWLKGKIPVAERIRYPLPSATRVFYMKKMFLGIPVKIIDSATCKSIYGTLCNGYYTAIALLRKQGYKNISIVLGKDRADEIGGDLAKYGVEVLSVERDGNSESVNKSKAELNAELNAELKAEPNANARARARARAMSATLLREFVMAGKAEKFAEGVMMGSMTPQNALNLQATLKAELNSIYGSVGRGGKRTRKQRKIKIRKQRKTRKYKSILHV